MEIQAVLSQTAAGPDRAGVGEPRRSPRTAAPAIASVEWPSRDQPVAAGITLGLAMLLNFTLALGAAYVRSKAALGCYSYSAFGAIASFIVALLALDGATYLVHRLLHQVPTALARASRASHRRVGGRNDCISAAPDRRHPALQRSSPQPPGHWVRRPRPLRFIACSARSTRCSSTPTSACRARSIAHWCGCGLRQTCTKFITRANAVETDSNYANLFSFFDRLFRTFTPSTRGPSVRYGIHGYDTPAITRSARCCGCRSEAYTLPLLQVARMR